MTVPDRPTEPLLHATGGAPVRPPRNVPSHGLAAAPHPTALRMQILAAEHWSLLASRGLAWNESFSRAAMYLSTLSGAMVALGLIAGISTLGHLFTVFALVILPVVLFVGIATFVRMGSANYHDAMTVMGMNRIRGAYLELVPELEPYFVMGTHDDPPGHCDHDGGSTAQPACASRAFGNAIRRQRPERRRRRRDCSNRRGRVALPRTHPESRSRRCRLSWPCWLSSFDSSPATCAAAEHRSPAVSEPSTRGWREVPEARPTREGDGHSEDLFHSPTFRGIPDLSAQQRWRTRAMTVRPEGNSPSDV